MTPDNLNKVLKPEIERAFAAHGKYPTPNIN
jgi:hypothetical protein